MKPQFEVQTHHRFFRVGWRIYRCNEGGDELPCRMYRHRWRRWYRLPATMQERRRNAGDLHDREYHARGRRQHLPTSYDDLCAQRIYGKSWKDYTRYKKQWMQNLD